MRHSISSTHYTKIQALCVRKHGLKLFFALLCKDKMIVCCQPRKIAAVSLAHQVRYLQMSSLALFIQCSTMV
jgi:HrpA-like RNA helicase